MLVLLFCYAILLWCISTSELMAYFIVSNILEELMWFVFSSVVYLYAANLLPYFSYSYIYEFLKLWKSIIVFFRKKTRIYLENSSINIIIYRMPLIKCCLIGPNTSDCTSSDGSFTLNFNSEGFFLRRRLRIKLYSMKYKSIVKKSTSELNDLIDWVCLC